MMRASLFVVVFLCQFALRAQDQLTVNLQFIIRNLPASEEVQLAYRYGEKYYILEDLGTSQSGAFNFQSDSVNRGVYMINFKNKNAYFDFVINEPAFSIMVDYNDPNGTRESMGSKENEALFDYTGKNFEVDQRMEQVQTNTDWDDLRKQQEREALITEINLYRETVIAENPDLLVTYLLKSSIDPVVPEVPAGMSQEEGQMFQFNYYRDHYFDHVDFSNSALLYSPVLYTKLQVYRDQLTYQEPDSLLKSARHMIGLASVNPQIQQYLIIEFFNFFARSKTVCMDKAYVAMADQYYTSGLADWVDAEQLNKIAENANNLRNNLCGEKAFNFTLKDANGKTVSLNSVEADWTILIFLKSDCTYCDRELGVLKTLDLSGIDYKIVTVHLKDDQDWKQQMEGYNFGNWINLTDATGLIDWKREYNLNSFPLIYILDKEKVIKYKKIGADQIPSILR